MKKPGKERWVIEELHPSGRWRRLPEGACSRYGVVDSRDLMKPQTLARCMEIVKAHKAGLMHGSGNMPYYLLFAMVRYVNLDTKIILPEET